MNGDPVQRRLATRAADLSKEILREGCAELAAMSGGRSAVLSHAADHVRAMRLSKPAEIVAVQLLLAAARDAE